MTRLHWILVGLCLLGLVNPVFWLLGAVLYEFCIRKGKTAMAMWLATKIGTRD